MPKAMILAAGLGTRLMPLTANQPKALVPLAGKPLIEHVLERFRKFNLQDIIVNLHHHHVQLRSFLEQEKFSDLNILYSDESAKLLDTGGGIRKAAWFFNDGYPFLVHNCDVISEIPLDEMINSHIERKAVATLAVTSRITSRPLAFDFNGLLINRWDNHFTAIAEPLAFSGIYILDPAIFSIMPGTGSFPIIDVLIKAATKMPVIAWKHDPEIWVDAGRPENFSKALELIKNAHL